MRVDRIEIHNFRNYKNISLEFHPKGNLFIGRNGAGKTNLLEALYTLAMAKSYRGRDEEVITFGEDYFRIMGSGIGIEGNLQVEISAHKSRDREKRILRNGHQVTPAEWVGFLLVIPLSLEDGEIIRGAPEKRRLFLNILLSLHSRSYFQDLLEYRRVLRQRNRFLQEGKGKKISYFSVLDGWNQQLVEIGARIMSKREEMIQNLSEDVLELTRALSSEELPLKLIYKPSLGRNSNPLEEESDSHDDPSSSLHSSIWEKRFWEALEKVEKKERDWGKTLVGPHLDEMKIRLNGFDIRHFGSEGEQRTAAIALKLAMAAFLEKEKKRTPILLLDEIFAELDEDRSMRLLSLLLAEYRGQIFIATAKEERTPSPFKDFRRFRIEKGHVQ